MSIDDVTDFGDLGGFGGGVYQGIQDVPEELLWQTYTTTQDQEDVWTYLQQVNPTYAVSDDPRFKELALSQFYNGWSNEYFSERLSAKDWGRSIILSQLDMVSASGGYSGASREQNIASMVATLSDTASQLGLMTSTERITEIATQAVDNYWQNAQVIDELMADLDPTALLSGDIKAAANEFSSYATSLRMPMSAEAAVDYAVRVARGEMTIQGAQDDIRSGLAQVNPRYAELVNLGVDLNTYDTLVQSVTANAERFGVTLSQDQVASIAQNAAQYQWSDAQIQSEIVSGLTSADAIGDGTITALRDQIVQTASRYLLPMTQGTAMNLALRQMRGELDEAGVQSLLSSQAKGAMPWLSDLIDQGITPEDYFSPLREYAATNLEMNANDIDLLDAEWQDVLTTMDNGQRRGATLSEIGSRVRRRSEWASTNAARNATASVVSAVANVFGLRGF